MIGKHALRKTANLPNRTCVGVSLMPYFKAHIHPNLFVQVPDQFDAFFNPKNASENSAKNITPSVGQLEKRTSFRATHRFKPLTEPCVSYGKSAAR